MNLNRKLSVAIIAGVLQLAATAFRTPWLAPTFSEIHTTVQTITTLMP